MNVHVNPKLYDWLVCDAERNGQCSVGSRVRYYLEQERLRQAHNVIEYADCGRQSLEFVPDPESTADEARMICTDCAFVNEAVAKDPQT